MRHPIEYSTGERVWLAALGVFGFVAVNGVFAHLFDRWGVSRLGWGWFVSLSLLGSRAFAIPIVLLFPRRGEGNAMGPVTA